MTELADILEEAERVALSTDDPDSDRYWELVQAVHSHPEEQTFQQCSKWARDPESKLQRLANDCLAQLGFREPKHPFRERSYPILLGALQSSDADVVASALVAFGHLGAGRHLDSLIPLHRHPDALVRFDLAFALLGVDDHRAVAALVALSSDADADVRNWATFGLGSQIDLDTPEIRDALFARAFDQDPDARAEALEGLVRRNDPRASGALAGALRSEVVGSQEVQLAATLAEPSLLPALVALRSWWDVDEELLEEAIHCCASSAKGAD